MAERRGDGSGMNYADLLKLDGGGVVVLGAGQGIGLEVCRALSAWGAHVLCVDSIAELAQNAALEVGGTPFTADIRTRSGMESVFATARRVLKKPLGIVDIVARAHIAPIETIDDEAFAGQIDIVFKHAWLATQLGAPWLAEHGGGSVVFIGSISGLAAYEKQALYGSQKAALHHLAKCAAVEYGPRGVRFNSVVAGTTKTARLRELIADGWADVERLIPLRRAAEPSDIASVVLFMVSAMSRHITAQNIVVDGGATAVGHRPAPSLQK
jgi:NAD(P)-dependent dehydrogenase (short-subunit alcohol dehydrogenase family)